MSVTDLWTTRYSVGTQVFHDTESRTIGSKYRSLHTRFHHKNSFQLLKIIPFIPLIALLLYQGWVPSGRSGSFPENHFFQTDQTWYEPSAGRNCQHRDSQFVNKHPDFMCVLARLNSPFKSYITGVGTFSSSLLTASLYWLTVVKSSPSLCNSVTAFL